MKKLTMCSTQKDYCAPIVDVYYLDKAKDILCMSSEANDNDFGAGDLGGFTDTDGN